MNIEEKTGWEKIDLAIEDFGGLIRNYRKDHQLSLHDLAELGGYTPSFIWRIENKKRTPQLETKIRLLLVMWSTEEIHAYLEEVISREKRGR